IADKLRERLLAAYASVRVGNPLEPSTLMGPLIDRRAVENLQAAIERVKQEGGRILYGGEPLTGREHLGGCYVRPCIAEARNEFRIVQEETFGPLLYLIAYDTF